MTKIKNKKYFILGLTLSIFLIIVLIICIYTVSLKNKNNSYWVIRSFDDRVVLMNNGEVVEIFNNIVIDTLPNEDQKHLERGITFLTKDEALSAVEDYDG